MVKTELPFETYEKMTGKKWTGGSSPEVINLLKQAGITATPGSSAANVALQNYLRQGMIAPATAPIAPTQNVSASIVPTDNSSQNILDALSAMGGEDTYRKQMSDMISQMQQQQQSYLTTMQAQPTPAQTYTQYREQLGLPAQEAALTTTSQQIQKTEELLTNLESDINARASGMAMTEPLRNRLLATEQIPITKQLQQLSSLAGVQQTGVTSAREQLSNLLQLATQGQTQQAELAKEPLQFTQTLLPIMSQLAQYQTPKEQMAQEIMKQMILQQIAPTSTAQAGYETLSPGQTLYDPTTGQAIYTAPSDKTGYETLSSGQTLYDPVTGQTIYTAPSKGTATETQMKQVQMGITNAKNAINRMAILINELGLGGFGPTSRVAGYVRSQLAKAGLDDKAEEFESIRGIIKNVFALSLIPGGRGFGLRYTSGDVDTAMPTLGDTKEHAVSKIENLLNMLSDYENTLITTYGTETPVTGTTTSPWKAGITTGQTSSGLKFTVEQ